MKDRATIIALTLLAWALAAPSPAAATTVTCTLDDGSGLSAWVKFTLLNPTTLEVRARNTSTYIPFPADSADLILSGISWDFGHPGYNGDALITGGQVLIGPSSHSVNFTEGTYGSGYDVSGEWGYGNKDGTGALTNFITSMTSRATPFPGPDLHYPESLAGPGAGLVADPGVDYLGGQGAIQDEIIATLDLSEELYDLDFLHTNDVRVEFGSDSHFITTPEPLTVLGVLAGVAALAGYVRKRTTH